jgi:hypothetical protein
LTISGLDAPKKQLAPYIPAPLVTPGQRAGGEVGDVLTRADDYEWGGHFDWSPAGAGGETGKFLPLAGGTMTGSIVLSSRLASIVGLSGEIGSTVSIKGGFATNGDGGQVNLEGGDGGPNGYAGGVYIRAGQVAIGSNGGGSGIDLIAGQGDGTGGGGGIRLYAGSSGTEATSWGGGNIELLAGNSNGPLDNDCGSIRLTAGSCSNETNETSAGWVYINAGNSHSIADGGDIRITPGTSYGGGGNGFIKLFLLPTVPPPDPESLWNNNGVINIGAGSTGGGSGLDQATADTLYVRIDGTSEITGTLLLGGPPGISYIKTVDAPAGSNAEGKMLSINPGLSDGTANGVAFTLQGGTGANGGPVQVMGGYGQAGKGGNLNLSAGGGTEGFGGVELGGLPTVPQTGQLLWDNAGVINIGPGSVVDLNAMQEQLRRVEARLAQLERRPNR